MSVDPLSFLFRKKLVKHKEIIEYDDKYQDFLLCIASNFPEPRVVTFVGDVY